jgi:uncharacterized protein (PEP-CTERM system associated)
MTLRYSRDGVDAGSAQRLRQQHVQHRQPEPGQRHRLPHAGLGPVVQPPGPEQPLAGPSTSSNAGRPALRYSPQLNLTASVGYDSYDYQPGRTYRRAQLVAGFDLDAVARTSLNASFGHRYFGKTGSLAASHRSRHSVWSINYSDAVTTTRQQFLLPSTIDTAAMLDTLFSARFRTRSLRQQAVQAYLQATGLPPSLANNVNYLSNRYMRQKQLQAAVAFNWAHSSLVLAVPDRAQRPVAAASPTASCSAASCPR